MNLRFQILPRPGAEDPAEAWFVPGRSTARWVEFLVEVGLARRETRLFVVPDGGSGAPAAGVLVIAGVRATGPMPPWVVPCQCRAGCLYLPVAAELFPPMTDEEVRAFCPADIVFVHPGGWLTGFDQDAAVGVVDLLTAPEEVAADWNRARAGEPPLPELVGVLVETGPLPGVAGLLSDAGGQIGSVSPAELPPTAGEPRDTPLEKAGRGLGSLLAKGVLRLAGNPPQAGNAPRWIAALDDWARRQLHRIDDDLERVRHRELHRLLHLLEEDPERGLRHAIPLGGRPGRGLAEPSGRLLERDPEYDPAKLGSGPGDAWEVPEQLQRLLRLRYREMADREMRLGRHRRAAFIYAELLGDPVSAASALERGNDHRSAALIHETLLHNLKEAAECLRRGGLYAEAIERFERLGRWMEVAELQGMLGNTAAARTAWERVVGELLGTGDIVAAAALIDSRLGDPERALGLLFRAWPDEPQRLACLRSGFAILGRLKRTEVALGWLERNGAMLREQSAGLETFGFLVEIAQGFPGDDVRRKAALLVREVVSGAFRNPQVAPGALRSFAQGFQRLASGDGLLKRELNRFVTERGRQLRSMPAAGGRDSDKGRLRILARIALPRELEWLELRVMGDTFHALGTAAGRLVVAEGSWTGIHGLVEWRVDGLRVGPRDLVFDPALGGPGQEAGLLVAVSGVSLPVRRLHGVRERAGLWVGTPAWMVPQRHPVVVGLAGYWTVHADAGVGVLSCLGPDGGLLQTEAVPLELLQDVEWTETTRFQLACVDEGPVVVFADRLLLRQSEAVWRSVTAPVEVMGVVPTRPRGRRGLLVTGERGAYLHWRGAPGWISVDPEVERPVAAFLPAGDLVLASGDLVRVLGVQQGGMPELGRATVSAGSIASVCPKGSTGALAVLTRSGEVLLLDRS